MLAQQAPFSAGANAVLIDVLVTRDGKPVPGLTAADFEIRDAGTMQSVQLVGVEKIPVHMLLALDTSASVRGPGLDHLKDAAKAAVASLRPGDRASVLTFSQAIALGAPWTEDRIQIQKAIDAAVAQGSTSLNDAAFAALALPPGRAGRTLVLLFTDGDDSSSWLSAATVIEAARRSDAVIYGVMLGSPDLMTPDQRRTKLLEDPSLFRGGLLAVLADDTGGESLVIAATRDLRATFLDVVARFNLRYVLSYSPASPPGPGWHPVDVRVKDPALKVTARRGYAR